MNSQYALDLAGYAGELLLKNGAEIFRIQDTMHRILNNCGYPNHNIYVISNGIFATVNEGKEDRCTLLRHVPLGFVHLGMISKVNRIARNLENHELSPDEAFDALSFPPCIFIRWSSGQSLSLSRELLSQLPSVNFSMVIICPESYIS